MKEAWYVLKENEQSRDHQAPFVTADAEFFSHLSLIHCGPIAETVLADLVLLSSRVCSINGNYWEAKATGHVIKGFWDERRQIVASLK